MLESGLVSTDEDTERESTEENAERKLQKPIWTKSTKMILIH